jgi:hypothetical protein
MNNNLLDKKWKNYFNWVIVYPLIVFTLIILGVFLLIDLAINSQGDSLTAIVLVSLALIGAFVITIGKILLIVLLFYIIWYFLASDELFKLMGKNRVVWNIVNVILFLLSGLFIMPLVLWFQIKSYWRSQGISTNWKGRVE